MHVDACGMQVDAYVDVASGVVNAGNIVPAFTLWSFFLVFVIQNFNNQTHIHFFFFVSCTVPTECLDSLLPQPPPPLKVVRRHMNTAGISM